MVSILNGLSQMGTGIADFASTAGLNYQKADLNRQGIQLAADLEHQSRTAEIAQTGTIAAGAATELAKNQMAQLQETTRSAAEVAGIRGGYEVQAAQATAGGMVGAAGVTAAASRANVRAEIAANAPLVNAQIADLAQKTIIDTDQAAMVHKTLDLSTKLGLELDKPKDQQDPAVLSQLFSERNMINQTPQTMGQLAIANDTIIKGFQQMVTSDNADIARLTAEANNPITSGDPAALARVNAELARMTTQHANDTTQLNSALMTGRGLTAGPQAPASGAPAPAPSTGTAPPATQFLPQTAPQPAPAGAPAAAPPPNYGGPPTFPTPGAGP